MRIFKTDAERKATEHERLFNRDFPWLWAIRHEWLPGFGRIEVIDVIHKVNLLELEHFLTQTYTAADCEVWVRVRSQSFVRVSRIEIGAARTWASAIYENLVPGYLVENIAVAWKTNIDRWTLEPEQGRLIKVYRSKGSESLHDILCDYAKLCRVQTVS